MTRDDLSIGANLQGVACMRILGAMAAATPVRHAYLGCSSNLSQGNTSTFVATGLTGDDGAYAIRGLPPGNNYLVMFFDCTDQCEPVYLQCDWNKTPETIRTLRRFMGSQITLRPRSPGQVVAVQALALYLPVFSFTRATILSTRICRWTRAGDMYDSRTRKAVAGVRIRLTGPVGFDPAIHMVQNNLASSGAINKAVTGASGFYQFFFLAGSPAGEYALSVLSVPAGYILGTATQGGVSQPNEVAGVVTSSFVVANTQVKIQPDYLISNGIPPSAPTVVRVFIHCLRVMERSM